ncbi:MAG: hypothetical protein ACK4M7_09405 [Burkholderiales bacterium]
MKKVSWLILVLGSINGSVYAATSFTLLFPSGFKVNDYQQCNGLIQQCPKQGHFPARECVSKLLAEKSECKQLNQLAQVLNMPADAITVKPLLAKFMLVKSIFYADGQEHDYIMSPTGLLVDTQIDPRKLDLTLARKYKTAEFMMVNYGEPYALDIKHGQYSFIAPLKITKNCLACAPVGMAKIKFTFTPNGKAVSTYLAEFKESTAAIKN